MKRELRKLLKIFFELKTINWIGIKKEITPNGRWVRYKIEFLTLNK
jgi:hypothetical protein